jgi:hypothetical protein
MFFLVLGLGAMGAMGALIAKTLYDVDQAAQAARRMATTGDIILKLLAWFICIVCAQYVETMPTKTLIFNVIHAMSNVFAIYLGIRITCDLDRLRQ